MEFTYIDDNIFYIENFISEDENRAITQIIKNAQWKDVGNFLLTDVPQEFILFNEINKRLQDILYENEFALMPRIIQKYTPEHQGNYFDSSGSLSKDWSLAPHADRFDNAEESSILGISNKSSHV